jgi:uncharacterized protein (TIGR03118 family)
MNASSTASPTAFSKVLRRGLPAALLALSLASSLPALADSQGGNSYLQHNLVSNVPGAADKVDPQLVNGWGIAFNPAAVVWVSDNGSGVSTLYDGLGNKQSLVVTIPAVNGAGQGVPTGITFNVTNDFLVTVPNSNPPPAPPTIDVAAKFLFATEDGGIFAWGPGLTTAVQKVPAAGAATTAVYKGIAIAGDGGAHFMVYAADFHNMKIDVFDNGFNPVVVAGGFADPNIPAGFGPFNIMNIGGTLYVAYALKEANGDDEVAGAGLGFVDAFDADGVLLARVATRGKLNAPWGMALAPAGFGKFSNALLVGNFGDGTINAFDLKNGTSLGQLRDTNGNVLAIDGLWGLAFGNGVLSQPTDVLFFAAGPNDEGDGLYGFIAPTTPISPGNGNGNGRGRHH